MDKYINAGPRKRLMIAVWICVLMLALLFALTACTSGGSASPGGSGTPAPTTAPGGY